MSMANPIIINLADYLFPTIYKFFIQREREGRPKATLSEINTHLKEQQELGKISGLTFRGTSGTYSYQVEGVINIYVLKGILEEDRSQLLLTSHGKKKYKDTMELQTI